MLLPLPVAAIATNTLFGGRAFCHVLCPVGVVERIYTDGDGRPDIVVNNFNERAYLYRNRFPAGNWAGFRLEGTESNRDAIGAKIKLVTPSGRTLYNHVTVSVGFMSSSDRRVHFGLGSDTSAASVEIRWPGGAVTTTNVPPSIREIQVSHP